MSPLRAVSVLATLSVLSAPGRADILFVGGPGADFTEIQPAVNAAAEGDTIRVWPGSYATFTIDDKDLRIVGRAELGSVEPRLIRVNHLSAGKTVVLHGLSVIESGKEGLILFENAGSVRVQHCEFRGRPGNVTPGEWDGLAGVRVLSCADAAFSDVVAVGGDGKDYFSTIGNGSGGHGMDVQQSSVALDCVTLTGGVGGSAEEFSSGDFGGHGLLVVDSFVSISGAQLLGGHGGAGGGDWVGDPCATGSGGDGGDGLHALESTIDLRDADLAGGPGGAGGPSCCGCPGDPGAPGAPLEASLTTVRDLPGAGRSLEAPAYVVEGSTIDLRIHGESGDAVYLYRSTATAFEPRGTRGVWLVDLPWLSSPAGPYAMLPPTPLVPLGVIGASGVLDVPYAVGDLPPAASVRTLYVQVLARGVSTTALTGASALVIVDAGP